MDAVDDIAFFILEVKPETPFLAEVLVPVHAPYARFHSAFALIGRDFPKAPTCLPVRPIEGYGALVFLDDAWTACDRSRAADNSSFHSFSWLHQAAVVSVGFTF